MTKPELLILLQSLSIEEKVAQLCQVDISFYCAQAASATGPEAEAARTIVGIGSVICGGNAEAATLADVQQQICEQSPHHIPALIMSDVIHGMRTIFPIPLALGCSFDPKATNTMARVSAKEAAACGIHVTLLRWLM